MPTPKEENLEEWVSNRFGRRLYEIFFKTYTEKVWGVPCTTIRAEWAAQRIKGLSLLTAIRNAILPSKTSDVKTLIDRFQYPERGPGQMWETLTDQLNRTGYPVMMERPVVRISHEDRRGNASGNGRTERQRRVLGHRFHQFYAHPRAGQCT